MSTVNQGYEKKVSCVLISKMNLQISDLPICSTTLIKNPILFDISQLRNISRFKHGLKCKTTGEKSCSSDIQGHMSTEQNIDCEGPKHNRGIIGTEADTDEKILIF